MEIGQYLAEVDRLAAQHRDQRYGQIAFNVLHDRRPEIALSIVGTEYDPFYIDNKYGPRFQKFVLYLADAW